MAVTAPSACGTATSLSLRVELDRELLAAYRSIGRW
jgi:hypothetical protein